MLWLLPLLARRGISDTIAKPLAWLANVLIVAALVIGVGWWVKTQWLHHDAAVASNAVSIHDKDLTIEAANLVMAATERADANQAARDDVNQNNAKEIDREAAKGDDSAVGVGTLSVLERMRQQQAAGRR